MADWPQLRLNLIVDDELINFVDSRIGIALRVGTLPDSNWIGRKLCDLNTVFCASAPYLGQHGTPSSIADLERHHWLALMRDIHRAPTAGTGPNEIPLPVFSFELFDGSTRERIELPVHTTTTNQLALQQMCEHGMGIARLFYADVRPALEQGLLVRVLPHMSLPSYSLTLLTASRDAAPAKARAAVAALNRHFTSLPELPRFSAQTEK